jgi:RND family efflux transporter MFP subunit
MEPSSDMKLKSINLNQNIVISLGVLGIMMTVNANELETKSTENTKPVLTVTIDHPQASNLEKTLNANGDVYAWQEAIIGNETDGLRLNEVYVNVGDEVKQGQLLAAFATETVLADLAQADAGVDEAKADLAEAEKNSQRARESKRSGALSEQQIFRYLTQEQTANARLESKLAAAKVQRLRLKQTRILAPDSGAISSRSATVGSVLSKGQELFRLIRQNRLEWRAEVASSELTLLKVGDSAVITTPNESMVIGVLRKIAPTVDQQTRFGLVYVDLPSHPALKTGMFAKGKFELGKSIALTVSQQSVVLRDGFSYVFKVGSDNQVNQVKVKIGRRSGDRLEIQEGGVQIDDLLVTSGTGFLNDGDLVKVASATNSKQ